MPHKSKVWGIGFEVPTTGLTAAQNATKRTGACMLDMAVYVEHLQDDPQVNEFYRMPVNAMRNLALAMATTDVVGIVDADFLVGPQSFVSLLQKNATVWMGRC